ncbi:helix-turn-helix domain-containing protein [Martelella alba]|uniref:Helix-turn-helix domain-containing protein n=1 Tax=Martelella alba TaxID=2590451 RepID=A0A506UAH1_9HYPH|nr:helix-turn-helix domain-containing protein [Martelella alba]TPW30518.1 helix-turn-helix domain-containing protein [Martelella alba]
MRDMARHIPVFVLVQPRVLLLDIAGPIEVLRKANLVQKDVAFDVRYIGPSVETGTSIGLTLAGISPLPAVLPDGAMVVIPGSADEPLFGPQHDAGRDDAEERAIIDWLARAIRPGIRLVSICSGATLAARAGLLEGYSCTTHHATIEALAREAPTARVLENRIYVEDGERFSSAGITAGVDLMLAILAREAGHRTALEVARYLVVYLRRSGSDPQISPFLEGRNHIHPVIHRVQDAIAADPAADWSVAHISAMAGTSQRNLSRLFNAHVGMGVTDYVNRMRIALAREFVTGSNLAIEQIAERAGFSSTRHFRRVWQQFHDAPPRHARQPGRQQN